MPVRVLFLFGTRPEAIKLCPVVLHFRSQPELFDVRVCVTAQHRAMLDQVLGVFGVKPEYDLNLMLPGQTLFQSTSRMMAALEPVFLGVDGWKPEVAMVQGDTTTTFCGALAAFYARVPVGHIEAGLRTGDLTQPFPEELNRVLTGRMANLHFAATSWAAENLRKEGVADDRIWVTGNTGIDAVLHVKRGLEEGRLQSGMDWSHLNSTKKLVLVTAHRRESFGAGFERICEALAELSERPDVEIVYPVHPNPNVVETVNRTLTGRSNVHLIAPLEYVPFIDLMRRAYLLITDSGGVQEEGPSLGKPILVLREKTERPEAVAAGTVKLVGTDRQKIVAEANLVLNSAKMRESMAVVHNPYGDGHASERISAATLSFFRK
ncbi:MAG: UDP-N-acetylglucosamine 2-epimerase (non-hydrolyzing) [Acidobacteria bacterium]|nr:UDP-N-acetylglucosamine 2-epimerase (non-hydrolyzing) [Acidobacteriota bacterium]